MIHAFARMLITLVFFVFYSVLTHVVALKSENKKNNVG